MSKKEIKQLSLKKKLLWIVLFPVLLMGILLVTVGMSLLYRSYVKSIYEELAATTSVLVDCLELTVRGDYSYEDEVLKKGNLDISDSTMLYRISRDSQIDTTVFWQDIRVLTTVENEYGVSAVGTKANPAVTKIVIDEGKEYFSSGSMSTGLRILDIIYRWRTTTARWSG